MALTREQRLSNDNVIFQAIGVGLYALLITSIKDHLENSGDDREANFVRIKSKLDASLLELKLSVPGKPITEVERQRLEADVQRRVGIMLNHAYRAAREQTGLPQVAPSQAH